MDADMDVYKAVDRRATPDESALMFLLHRVHDAVEKMDHKLTAHIADETEVLAQEIAKHMKIAFPEGDPEGHRRHHEAIIRKAERRADFWDSMAKEIGKWGLIGFLGWVVVSLWRHGLENLK